MQFVSGYKGIAPGSKYAVTPRLHAPEAFSAPAGLDESFIITPIENQMSDPCCVACSGTTHVETTDWYKKHFYKQIPYLQVHRRCMQIDGNPNANTGTYGTTVHQALIDLGYIPATASLEIITNELDLLFALHKHRTCMVALNITDGFRPENCKDGWVGSQPGILGGHMMLCCGYRMVPRATREGYLLANSWGKDWGQGGFIKIDRDKFLTQFKEGYVIVY